MELPPRLGTTLTITLCDGPDTVNEWVIMFPPPATSWLLFERFPGAEECHCTRKTIQLRRATNFCGKSITSSKSRERFCRNQPGSGPRPRKRRPIQATSTRALPAAYGACRQNEEKRPSCQCAEPQTNRPRARPGARFCPQSSFGSRLRGPACFGTKEPVLRPRQPEMIAQRMTFVRGAENSAAL